LPLVAELFEIDIQLVQHRCFVAFRLRRRSGRFAGR